MSILITEVMTCRGAVTTYKAEERRNNRTVMMKSICTDEGNEAFWKELNRMKECDSKYIVKYTDCYENENEYKVWKGVVFERIDCNGEL